MSFAREAERATGIRAKRSSFMVENLNLVILSFIDLEVPFSDFLVGCSSSFLNSKVLLVTVALTCVAPLFYTALPN